jgi:DNA-binding GntR family transcriptional regulator
MNRRRDFFLPPIVLDRASPVPLHAQLQTQFATAILRDAADGGRLPSTRTLARIFGVSRNTVLTAYDELAAKGLIRGQHGLGMFVSTKERQALPPFDLRGVLREAQYPARTVHVADVDGNSLCLVC